MPEFLERRYNKTCRYIYALVSLTGMVIALLGGVMYAGGKAINVFFPQISVHLAIIILAVAAGVYTIYGGLLSGAWADFVQYCLLMLGGFTVLFFGLHYVGGWDNLVATLPEKFIMFYPSTHEAIPWSGILSVIFTVGIWYSCANQFMVQRCLGARSEWDARMGVVMSGFSYAVLPFIVVVPGIIAFQLFHSQISDGDRAWPYMVSQFLPVGFIGLVLAGLASAVMSTLSAITTSSSTIISLDIYKPVFRPNASDREMHNIGRISGTVIMLIGVVLALIMASYSGITVFGLIQKVYFYVAPPIAAIFLIGILWRRATSAAGTATLILGFFVYLPLTVFVLFPKIDILKPYNNFMHQTLLVWILSVITLVVVSLFTRPKSNQELRGVIWTKSAFGFLGSEKNKHRGFQSLKLWWGVMVLLFVCLYIYTQSIGSNAQQFEAEKLRYSVSVGSRARIQKRNEITKKDKAFNLWTNSSQVLFMPAADEAAVSFELPVEQPGRYEVAVIVTMGPDYGKFSATVNGRLAKLRYFLTEASIKGEKFTPVEKLCKTFDACTVRNTDSGTHVVQRISLGIFELSEDLVSVSFIAKDVEDAKSIIGVDQFMLTYQKD
jgi:SSS family solute:Na+ symporter